MEKPVDELAAKLGILASVLASRLDGVEPRKAEQLPAPLGELTGR